MPQVSFEVYAFDGARWSLQQNFSAGQREAALEAAHRIYGQAHIKGVRVIQETFDPATGEASEKSLLSRTKSDDVPKSLKKEIRAPKAAAPPGAPKAKAEKKTSAVSSKAVPGAPVPKDMAPKAVASVTVPGAGGKIALAYVRAKASRFTGALAGGSVLAAGGSLLMMALPPDTPLLLALRGALGSHYLVAVAIALFGIGLLGSGIALLATAPAQRAMTPAGIYVDLPPAPSPADGVVPSAPLGGLRFPKIELEEDDHVPPADPAGLDGEALRLIAFFHDALAALPRDGALMKAGRLDAYNWFGCHLFFAGLAEEDGRRRSWDRETRQGIIATAMIAALADPKNAARFAARYEEYLTEPRALAMFNRGLEASAQRATGEPGASDALRLALEEWNRRGGEAPTAGHVCVMFTDIVGSTEFAQTHGDLKHYEMVQAHNRIVRAALDQFAGREIKHTGDGIMAAFDDAALAVRASQLIQREIMAHRAVAPEIGMSLRIGLAAGEPIREGSDLFGATVQLAARACGVAQPDQIVVGDAVRSIAEPAGLAFLDLGEQALKGFKLPARLHAVAEA
jgi:class 3 adenylate cyclase